MKALKIWLASSIALGLALVLSGVFLRTTGGVPATYEGGTALVIGGGAGLLLVALVVFVLRRPVSGLLRTEDSAGVVARHPYLTLFIVSFVVLFVEVLLIRYSAAQLRVFSFYKNVVLVSCFLGLGLGCCLGGGRARHAFAFLLWLVPLVVFLADGALILDGYLGRWASLGSSEQVLGTLAITEQPRAQMLFSQLGMGLFCVAMLVAVTLLFTLLGRLLGGAFETVPRLPGYTVNILGSLAGILAFLGLSYLETPPWLWLLIGLTPLLWWLGRGRQRLAGALLVVACAAVVAPAIGHTVWSRYQKLVGFEIPAGPGGTGTASPAFLVLISDVFYQVAFDLRPAKIASLRQHPFPHYDAIYRQLPPPRRVLVVGAGTGNDVAAALRAGAERVDAVDIDPAIVEMGRRFHPENPYGDPRVRVIVDDARRAFRELEPESYDAVIFGLLDSHTQLGISSLRLDNYVFTLDSFAAARRLLVPGGHLVISAATFRPWFAARMAAMLEASCGQKVRVEIFDTWFNYLCAVPDPASPPVFTAAARDELPTDDWPFLYLPARSIPMAYLVVVAMLMVASVAVLKAGGLRLERFSAYHAHLFFLGAAFLLMEVYAINRLALLFGTVWLVSAVTIALILTLIVAANVTVALAGRVPYPLAYGALIASLLISYAVDPAVALGGGLALALGYGLLVLSPVYFAGLIFARSFSVARLAGPAIGVNILGSVLGGWVEYATMAVGIRAMALLALTFYLVSWLGLLRWQARDDAPSEPARAATP